MNLIQIPKWTGEGKPYSKVSYEALFGLPVDYLSIVPRVMTDSSNCFVFCSQQRDEGGISVNTYTSNSLGRINGARERFPPFPFSLHLPPPHLNSPGIHHTGFHRLSFLPPLTLSHVPESASENECELTHRKWTQRCARPKFYKEHYTRRHVLTRSVRKTERKFFSRI